MPATGARATSSSGDGRGWSCRAGRPCCSATSATWVDTWPTAAARSLDQTRKYLAAAAEAPAGSDRARIEALARSHGLPADALAAWLDYLGLAGEAPVRIEGYLTEKDTRSGGYEYVHSWRARANCPPWSPTRPTWR